ncbi:hypothetical protein BSKO_02935 [Bryopsis sp. KO-2023]|nr:hypothetical protein BSKO_02935 [Bryopsis sp. KO-2023]
MLARILQSSCKSSGLCNAAWAGMTFGRDLSTSERHPSSESAGLGQKDESIRSDSDVCILSVARTPLGAFQGSLSPLSATQLGSFAIRGAVERAALSGNVGRVDEVFMGNVLSANLGQAPAKQASLGAGLSHSTPCTTINKVCASGMKAVMMAAQSIKAGCTDVVVAGGMESMSNVPYYLPAARSGLRMGDTQCVDGMIKDGLRDPYFDIHMGNCGEECAEAYGVTRLAQDGCAVESFKRAIKSKEVLDWERVPVEVFDKKGMELVNFDECVGKFDEEKLRGLKPVFQSEGGTITPGNSSQISDGAAAVVLARRSKAAELNLPILGRIVSMADAAQEPKWFTTSPSLAYNKALDLAGMTGDEIDYVEINQAFAVVDLVNQGMLGLDSERVNVLGGAIALGHPIGCSGARLVVTLMNVLRVNEGRYGAAAICNGGGGASAVVIEREP